MTGSRRRAARADPLRFIPGRSAVIRECRSRSGGRSDRLAAVVRGVLLDVDPMSENEALRIISSKRFDEPNILYHPSVMLA